jgi:hypothetical protein
MAIEYFAGNKKRRFERRIITKDKGYYVYFHKFTKR